MDRFLLQGVYKLSLRKVKSVQKGPPSAPPLPSAPSRLVRLLSASLLRDFAGHIVFGSWLVKLVKPETLLALLPSCRDKVQEFAIEEGGRVPMQKRHSIQEGSESTHRLLEAKKVCKLFTRPS